MRYPDESGWDPNDDRDPPMDQSEIDAALIEQVRDAVIDGIPQWERVGYDKLAAAILGES
jgi:hypothetical protein